MAARSLGEFQGVSEAPVSHVILVERATRKFAQRTAARRVELKMGLRLRCFSVTGRKEHAPSSRLGAGHFELNHRQVIPVTQHCMWFGYSWEKESFSGCAADHVTYLQRITNIFH